MTVRRVMLVIALVLLVCGATVVGIVIADWPDLRRVRAIGTSSAVGTWPEAGDAS